MIDFTFELINDIDPDPDYNGSYLDICVMIDNECLGLGYSRPLHLNTTVLESAAIGQPNISLVDIGELDWSRKVLIDDTEYDILSVDNIANTIVLETNLSTSLIGGETVTTTDITVENEIRDDLTQRGYVF